MLITTIYVFNYIHVDSLLQVNYMPAISLTSSADERRFVVVVYQSVVALIPAANMKTTAD